MTNLEYDKIDTDEIEIRYNAELKRYALFYEKHSKSVEVMEMQFYPMHLSVTKDLKNSYYYYLRRYRWKWQAKVFLRALVLNELKAKNKSRASIAGFKSI